MKKEEFLIYLPEKTYGIFSTVREDGTPEARGFELMFEEDDKYYFGTANNKEVWEQISKHQKAAFTYMEPMGKYTVRLCGDVKVVTDAKKKEELFGKIDPMVAGMYKSWDNPVFEIIYMDKPECKFANGFAPTETVK